MFQTLAGPGGGISMNGAELKQKHEEINKLEEELLRFVTSTKYAFYHALKRLNKYNLLNH